MARYNFSDVVSKSGGRMQGGGDDLYSKLTLLYKHGIGTKYSVKPTSLDKPVKSAHQKKLADQFAKATSDYYMRVTQVTPDRFRSYEDFMAMDYCLAGETRIATPNGFVRIDELSNMGKDNEFIVYAYDHNKEQVVPALARNAHYTRDEMTYKITFDDDSHIIGTWEHMLMCRDGSFKRISELSVGDSMMPFYRKDNFYPEKRYNHVYTCNKNVGWNGWISEHKLIAEWAHGEIQENEVVHHLDFNGKNNNPENLKIMDKVEHQSYHCKLTSLKNWSDPKIREKLLLGCKKGGSSAAKKVGLRNSGKNNPSYIHIPFDLIVEVAKVEKTLKGTANKIGVSYATIQKKIKDSGYNDWKTFLGAYGITPSKYSTDYYRGGTSRLPENRKRVAENTWNHKIKSIEEYGVIPVYDLTVPGYKNFATDTIFSHNTPEIASALDIYADESLTLFEDGSMLKITTENTRIQNILEDLFYQTLDIKKNLWTWTRETSKYGDFYLLLDIQPGKGVVGWLDLPVREIERIEGYDGNINSIKFNWSTQGTEFDNWQIAHFRLLIKQDRIPYGTSMLESSRRIWKQLQMSEDAMIIYRITRAPERRIFYIDVGNIDPGDVKEYVEKVKNTIKRAPYIKEDSGNVFQKYNPMAIDEDFFIPRRNEKNSSIETLPGATNLSEIADIEYLQNKMLSALKIPKAYLTFDGDINAKATLATEDFRFARTINRIQQSMITTLNQIAITHLYTLGFRDREQLSSFDIKLANPSIASETAKLEMFTTKANTLTAMWDPQALSPISLLWGLRNIYGFTDNEIRIIMKQQYLEGKINLDIQNSSNPNTAAAMGAPVEDMPVDPDVGMEVQDLPNQEDVTVTEEGVDPVDTHIEKMIKTMGGLDEPKPQKRNILIDKNNVLHEGTQKLLDSLENNYKK